MSFNIFKRSKKDAEEEKREEWLRDLGFDESYGDADAERKHRQRLIDDKESESEKFSRQRFDWHQAKMMDEKLRRQMWAQDRGLPFVELDRVTPDAAALGSIPADLARKHRVLPIKREGAILWLAMADVADHSAVEAVRTASACRVIPVVAMPHAVRDAIECHYSE